MRPQLGVEDWIFRPIVDGSPVHQQVRNHVLGIMRIFYPGQGFHVVEPKALAKYGPDLFPTVHNIVTECEESQQTATAEIRLVDGRPVVNVIRRRIIDPTVN